MLIRRRSAVLFGVTGSLALAAVPGAFAAAPVNPPVGTPNMALMVLQPSDLAPGADITAQRYVSPAHGFSAEYASVLSGATTTDGTKFDSIEDDVALASSTITASNRVALSQTVFSTAPGRRGFIKVFIKAAGKKADLKARNFTFAPMVSAGTGANSYVEIVTIAKEGQSIQEGFVGFADGDTYAALVLIAKTVPQPDALSLAQTVDAHIHAVLGTGTTGASGTT
ncbi:MAG: hypothetical protein ABSC56_06530 [Solirubrobacteraceae bacterium]|jgi:hypothetical protein